MALVVGEILAKIGAEKTGFDKTTQQADAQHKAFVKEVGARKAPIDADTTKVDAALGKTATTAKTTGQQINTTFAEAWRSVAADLDRMERGSGESLTHLRGDASRTGASLQGDLGGALSAVRADLDRLGSTGRQQMEEVADAAEDAATDIQSAFRDALQGGGVDAGGLLSSLTSGISGLAGGIASAGVGLGTALGAAIIQGAQQIWEQNQIGGLIAAQRGGSAAQGVRLGQIVGDAFNDGFGDSMEDVGAALNAALGAGLAELDAPRAELDRLTRLAVTASQVVGDEAANITRAAQQLLRTGLADSAEEAIDIIVRASQAGLNLAGDLTDTISEYATQFRVLGLEGAEGLGLVSQALKAGARDSDVAADALKEFAIRARDGSEATSRGFRALGLDASAMATEIGAGGDRASAALDETLDRLRAIEDPVLRSQAAVDLFGTQAEDLGDALFAMDLDTAAEQMIGYAGSTDEARAAIEAATPPMERFGRAWDGFVNSTFEGIKLGDLTIFGSQVAEDMGPAVDIVAKFRDAAADLAAEVPVAFGDAAAGTAVFRGELRSSSLEGAGLIETLDEIIDRQRTLAGAALDLSEAQIRWHEAVDAVDDALEDNGETLDINTEKGRNNLTALNDLADSSHNVAEAMVEQGASATDVQKHMERSREEFIASAIQLGATSTEAKRLADRLGLVPGDYKARVFANTSAAETALGRVGSWLDQLDGRHVTVHVGAVGGGLGLAAGAVMEYYADGGMRPMSASSAAIVQPHTRTGVMRVIADNPIANEAFIPLIPSSARSQAILDEVLHQMRPNLAALGDVMGMADGGVLGGLGRVAGGASAVGEDRHYTINNYGPDPDAVVRRMFDELDAREALHV